MSETNPPNWRRKFLEPVNLVFLVLGGVGLVLGLYSYVSYDRPIIAWIKSAQIVPDHQTGYPSTNATGRPGTASNGNTYIAQFTIWNAGNTRFDNVDDTTLIREPLTLRLVGRGRIISTSITNTLYATAGRWTIRANGPYESVMTWRHFDPDAAVRILVIYVGDDSTSITPTIMIAGGAELRQLASGQLYSSKAATTILNLFLVLLFSFGTAIAMLLLLMGIMFVIRKQLGDSTYHDDYWMLGVSAVTWVLVALLWGTRAIVSYSSPLPHF